MNPKETREDKFARWYYCKNARLNYLSFVKRSNRRKLRRIKKAEIKEAPND